MTKRIRLGLLLLTLLASPMAAKAATIEVSIGPAINNAAFWIDPSQPNHNYPASYQTWGMVITTPTAATSLRNFSLYASYGGLPEGATGFGISIFEWSPSLQQPVGPSLYQSPLFSLTSPSDSTPDPYWGVRPTVFSPQISVNGNSQYIIELLGNGAAGVLITSNMLNAQLFGYESNVGSNFHPFGEYALRSDMTYASAVPLPATLPLFGCALMCFAAQARRQRIKR